MTSQADDGEFARARPARSPWPRPATRLLARGNTADRCRRRFASCRRPRNWRSAAPTRSGAGGWRCGSRRSSPTERASERTRASSQRGARRNIGSFRKVNQRDEETNRAWQGRRGVNPIARQLRGRGRLRYLLRSSGMRSNRQQFNAAGVRAVCVLNRTVVVRQRTRTSERVDPLRVHLIIAACRWPFKSLSQSAGGKSAVVVFRWCGHPGDAILNASVPRDEPVDWGKVSMIASQ